VNCKKIQDILHYHDVTETTDAIHGMYVWHVLDSEKVC